MAITRSEGRGSPPGGSARATPHRRAVREFAPVAAQWAAGFALYHGLTVAASAQGWRVEPSARATTSVTSNSGFANTTDTGGDVILDVAPRVGVTGRGARFRLSGFVEADSLTFARNTQSNQFIPSANLTLNATGVERWLYLDASAGLSQSTVDPYSIVSSGTLPTERLQTTQYRLSPYLDHAFTPAVSLFYRNENTWTRRSGQASTLERRGNFELHGHSLNFAVKPEPLGFSLEAQQEQTSYTADPNATLDLASARAVLNYSLDPTLTLGIIGGRERSEFALIRTFDTIRGGRVRWTPTERTTLNASVEKRFFDTGWNLTWTHRSPFLAMNINWARQPSSQPSTFLLQNTGGDLRSLIDAAYTTRFPNPVERAVVVDNAVANIGTTSTSAEAIEIYSDYAQLQNRVTASAAFLGPRTTLTFQVFSLRSEQLQRADAPAPLGALPTVADNIQTGLSVAFNRRLTTTTSLETVLSAARTKGLGAATGDSTTSESARLAANHAVSPKTRLLAGCRVQRAKVVQFNQTTAVETRTSVSEIAGFLGVDHKF
jgi:uncharacterized protein (PEP-CTERM system associated)